MLFCFSLSIVSLSYIEKGSETTNVLEGKLEKNVEQSKKAKNKT